MCGIAGLARLGDAARCDLKEVAGRMGDSLFRRGPDDRGVWHDDSAGIALAHRRLAILDLSTAGSQPMVSPCSELVIVFNGEIYNHRELRRTLAREGHVFRGRSDTEVILASIRQWGLEESLRRFVGMFAFALWNRRERILSLARDRFGEKPVYFGVINGCLGFASELKAFREVPGWAGEVDRDVLPLYLRYGYVPSPHCIFRGLRKLEPGSWLEARLGAGIPADAAGFPIRRYWDAAEVARECRANPFLGDGREAAQELDRLLDGAVRGQMESDVPLGVFLSGGIDSSLIAAKVRALSPGRIRTFTIGFRETGFDEAGHARMVSEHLGTDHTELVVEPKDALEVIPSLPDIYDEPFADYSQVPTFLLAKLTREHVTVALSGDGGDELFYGYGRYEKVRSIWRALRRIPDPVRSGLSSAMLSQRKARLDALIGWMSPLLRKLGRDPSPVLQFRKLGELLAVREAEELYRRYVSVIARPDLLIRGGRELSAPLTEASRRAGSMGIEDRMMFLDAVSYLPDAIMTKMDRAGMAASLESRAPFLDHRIAEFAWRLPLSCKRRGGGGKWILRELLRTHVPARLFDRPKMGFGFPVAEWLRKPLRSWAEEHLDAGRLSRQGYLDPEPVRALWEEHLEGTRDHSVRLWHILMFQAWLEAQGGAAWGNAGGEDGPGALMVEAVPGNQ